MVFVLLSQSHNKWVNMILWSNRIYTTCVTIWKCFQTALSLLAPALTFIWLPLQITAHSVLVAWEACNMVLTLISYLSILLPKQLSQDNFDYLPGFFFFFLNFMFLDFLCLVSFCTSTTRTLSTCQRSLITVSASWH